MIVKIIIRREKIMSEPIKSPSHTPESYSPTKPEILSMAENALKDGQGLALPSEYIIKPKDRIAMFSGEKWPFSNVEPAVYSALGLLYGRTERRDDTGALVNDDIEYAIHNVLTGHAFGLFYCRPDDLLSMAAYGFTSCRLEIGEYSEEDIVTIIKDQIYRGYAVHIDEGNGRFDYLIWGYKNNGNILLGYRFEHGNDMVNCSFDLDNPSEFDSLSKCFTNTDIFKSNGEKIGGITLIQPDGDSLDRESIYKKALAEGCRMFTQIEPPPAMDFTRVHFGYGKAIYEAVYCTLSDAFHDVVALNRRGYSAYGCTYYIPAYCKTHRRFEHNRSGYRVNYRRDYRCQNC